MSDRSASQHGTVSRKGASVCGHASTPSDMLVQIPPSFGIVVFPSACATSTVVVMDSLKRSERSANSRFSAVAASSSSAADCGGCRCLYHLRLDIPHNMIARLSPLTADRWHACLDLYCIYICAIMVWNMMSLPLPTSKSW